KPPHRTLSLPPGSLSRPRATQTLHSPSALTQAALAITTPRSAFASAGARGVNTVHTVNTETKVQHT
ncbi:Hypothetical predicted protein, partial [Podarcis lilfordi]